MEKEKILPQKRRVTRRKAAPDRPGEIGRPDPGMRRKMIADTAYYRFERRGFGNGGDHVEDWLQAEAEIDAMLGRRE